MTARLFDYLPDPEPTRVIAWFSCGATSAVMVKLALVEWPNLLPVRIVLGGEHQDAERFMWDCIDWWKRGVIKLDPPRFTDHFQAIAYHRYVNGPSGAKCTRELKRGARAAYERPGDLNLFGFDADESDRVADFRENNPDLWFKAPLIDAGLTKSDCKAILEKAGIKQHAMYELGYANANCIGCVKGGMGYWNRIRVDFPDVFARMAKLERSIGASVLKKNGRKLYLDELDPKAGRFAEDQPSDCGPLCQTALEKVGLN